MSGLGGLNRSPAGVVLGMVQLQLPTVTNPTELAAQRERIVAMVGKARRNLPGMDLVVFPEYSLHGLSMSTAPELMCRMDGPECRSLLSRRLPRQSHLGLLLDHGSEPARQSIQHRHHPRRSG